MRSPLKDPEQSVDHVYMQVGHNWWKTQHVNISQVDRFDSWSAIVTTDTKELKPAVTVKQIELQFDVSGLNRQLSHNWRSHLLHMLFSVHRLKFYQWSYIFACWCQYLNI